MKHSKGLQVVLLSITLLMLLVACGDVSTATNSAAMSTPSSVTIFTIS